MTIAMVKHEKSDKIYWFEVPDNLTSDVIPGVNVNCDTARGKQRGVVVGTAVKSDHLAGILASSGATFPLRKIISVIHTPTRIPMKNIRIPQYMARTQPCDKKIAKRFLEVYHTGKFNTNVVVTDKSVLVDGYSAYLVAKTIGFDFLTAAVICKGK